jgi:predicted O-methyltransferase YrrM
MDHFYHEIEGWFDFPDLYSSVVERLSDGAHVVEVGAWLGKSTAYLAVEILNSGKAIRFDVVDWFQGSPECDAVGATVPDQRAHFDANLAPVRHIIRDVHAEPSVEAAKRYRDGSLDFVFIDAAHATDSALADLEAWWPKLRPGGMLAGHDADWPSVQAAVMPWAWKSGVGINLASVRCWWARKPEVVPAADLVTPAGDRRCLVAVCSNERSIYRQTAESLIGLGWGQRVTQAAEAHGFADVQFAWLSKHVLVSDLRNEAARMAIGLGCSHVLFMDADMTWPGDVLSKMLAHHDQGVVSGLYHLKYWPHWPVALHTPTVNTHTLAVDYHYAEDLHEQRGLRPMALVGMGCALVPTVVFQAMPEPWFEYRQNLRGEWTITEDVPFCQKVAAMGVPILVDPTVKCGHIGADRVSDPHYDRARVEMRMLEQAGRKLVPA